MPVHKAVILLKYSTNISRGCDVMFFNSEGGDA